jgi:serine/threonine-protein kinase
MSGTTDPTASTLAAPLEDSTPALDDAGVPLIADRYELLGMLGAGAMGSVYRARDRELDEIVALKVLNRELAASPGMLDRFRREVKLARRVTHKNVARTYDIGEHAGDRFLTMEFVEGEVLAARLSRLGRLGAANAVRIARDLCAGLAAAHAAGVIHRDLKPENVIVARDGRAVITDFGIAHVLAGSDTNRTASGALVGTPAYMAPEQVEGSADLDARADLYALGVILYELLTGEVAWPGATIIAVAAARLLRPPPDARAKAPDVPEALAAVVRKLMARAREDRYATAEEADAALAALAAVDDATAAPSPQAVVRRRGGARRSIAVLPIKNESGPDDEYLAQTTTADLVDQLSIVPELRVRARGDVSKLASARDAREIGRALGVDVVVEGWMRRLGDQVRAGFRLLTVSDGFQLWARRFVRPASSVLTIADEAATAIAHALTAERAAALRAEPSDPVAQELYLRGRHLMHGGWFQAVARYLSLFREAHLRAPDDARITSALAFALARAYANESAGPEAAREARELAERALASAPMMVQARLALAMLHLAHGEGSGAIVELHRALANAPNDVDALEAMGRLLAEVGRPEEGLALLQRAVAIEPGMGVARFGLARVGALLGEHDLFLDRMGPLPSDLDETTAYTVVRARLSIWAGATEDARELLRRLTAMGPPGFAGSAAEGLLSVAARVVTLDQVREPLMRAMPLRGAGTARRACFNAQIHAEVKLALGAPEEAMEAVRVSDEHGLIDIVWLDRCPLLAEIRSDPRFQEIRRKTAIRTQRVLAALDSVR